MTVMTDETMELRRRRHGLLVRVKVKELALTRAAQGRKLSSGQPRFTRVSEAFVDRINAQTTAMICAEVDRLPSSGRTIR